MARNNIYKATSPYYYTDVTGNKYLDVMVNRPIPMFDSDVYWEIKKVYEYRPDLLAYDLYNDPKLWWVFSQRNPNRLKDPYFDFVTGLGIYIPKHDVLINILGL